MGREQTPLPELHQADGIESAQKEVKVKGATRETLAFLMVLGELTCPPLYHAPTVSWPPTNLSHL